ncbi:hypothetical protein ACK6D9_18915 [Hoeflea sp. Naph1]|uniref:hypothetical protein n=1 Tax=Hoeflea sp. Naph1 TaxID=3388653 RepID=UPI00398FAFAA
MIQLDLPDELGQLLTRFADEIGISKEDLAAGEATLANDDSERISLPDIIAEFGDGTIKYAFTHCP